MIKDNGFLCEPILFADKRVFCCYHLNKTVYHPFFLDSIKP